jgi:HAD superfamily hydrolase (TIGR01509 family)
MQIGVLFDWDGVIIDSSAHHEESWERLARETGKPLPDGHFRQGFGMKNEFIIPHLLKWTDDATEIADLSLRKEALYRQVVRERGIRPLPGVRDLISKLKTEGVTAAVASSTHRENITTALPLLGLENAFADLVTAEDVSHGKPDPEVFLMAASRLGLPAERCVVLEDTQVGIDAAHRGGIKVVGVATTHPESALAAADLVVKSLAEVDPATLAALMAAG